MVERITMGGGLILLWRVDLDVCIQIFSPGHIDAWISNWLPTSGCFFTGFYGHWNTSQSKHSWALLRRIGHNRSLPWCTISDFNEYSLTMKLQVFGDDLHIKHSHFDSLLKIWILHKFE